MVRLINNTAKPITFEMRMVSAGIEDPAPFTLAPKQMMTADESSWATVPEAQRAGITVEVVDPSTPVRLTGPMVPQLMVTLGQWAVTREAGYRFFSASVADATVANDPSKAQIIDRAVGMIYNPPNSGVYLVNWEAATSSNVNGWSRRMRGLTVEVLPGAEEMPIINRAGHQEVKPVCKFYRPKKADGTANLKITGTGVLSRSEIVAAFQYARIPVQGTFISNPGMNTLYIFDPEPAVQGQAQNKQPIVGMDYLWIEIPQRSEYSRLLGFDDGPE
jgi:hypothetical protein